MGEARRLGGTDGAVFVEFLIVFLPVLTMFLCLLQLAILFAVRLVVGHAAVNTARAAAVVIGDDPSTYREGGRMPRHTLQASGERYAAIRRAAVISMAPFIAEGTINKVDVLFPPADQPGAKGSASASFAPIDLGNISKVRVRIEVETMCKIAIANRIACGSGIVGRVLGLTPTRTVRAEAVYPYQGARYEYPP
jgi:hypothetical protein